MGESSLSSFSSLSSLWFWHPAIQIGVRHEEAVHIPQRDKEPPPSLVGLGVAEGEIRLGLVVDEHPAHDVCADFLRGFVELEHVAPALVHRATVPAQQGGVAEAGQIRWLALEHRAHHQHAVEPVAELAGEALGDEVGREPLLPVVPVVAIAEGGERHNAGVKPGIAHVLDAADLAATVGADDLHRINPRTMRSVALELFPALNRTLLQLVLTADDFEVAADSAFPDGQSQAPVPLLADHPVVHVAQPVQLPLQAERRDPTDLVGDVHDLVAQTAVFLLLGDLCVGLVVQLAHTDEPLVHQTEDQLFLAAPAGGITVGEVGEAIEQPLALQVGEDVLSDLLSTSARQPVKALDVDPVLV